MNVDPLLSYIEKNQKNLARLLYGKTSGSKKYTQAERYLLSPIKEITGNLSRCLHKRWSCHNFSELENLSLFELSQLLYWSLASFESGKEGISRKPYPSGGSLYPIEPYLIITRPVENIPAGLYHYNSNNHQLEKLSPVVPQENKLKLLFLRKYVKNPQIIICFSFIKERNVQEYGSMTYSLSFLEAGHVGQNVCLVATSLDLGSCPLGTSKYAEINQIFGFDGVNENYLYSIAVGKKNKD